MDLESQGVKQMLHKYRATTSFRYLVDIILKSRLYAAPYFDLNDPMEGYYLMSATGMINDDMQQMLKSAKERMRICSLSRLPDNPVMWSHYADGHRGVVIGLDVADAECEIHPIIYDGPIKISIDNFNGNSPIEILSRKLVAWEYEAEERVFTRGKHYVSIVVHELILGSRMSNQDRGFIKDLCAKICPAMIIRDAEHG